MKSIYLIIFSFPLVLLSLASDPDPGPKIIVSVREILIPVQNDQELNEFHRKLSETFRDFGLAESKLKFEKLEGFAGVFTDPQHQVFLRAMAKKEGATISTLPKCFLKPGAGEVIIENGKRYQVIADRGKKNTIDLELSVLSKGRPSKNPQGNLITLSNGEAAVWASPSNEAQTMWVIVHTLIQE